MAKVPGILTSPGWQVGVPLLVECPVCLSQAVCKLTAFDPDDVPVCPACDQDVKLNVLRVCPEPSKPATSPHPKMVRRN